MATEDQIKANQENSKLSSGPRSESGLKSSSQNATKHGFTGHTLCLPPEEEEPFREFKEKHLTELQPVGVNEEACAYQIVDNRWRLNQITATEAAIYELGRMDHAEKFAAHPPEKITAMCRALTLNEKQKDLSLLNRYQSRLTKQVSLDLKELEERQRTRKTLELKQFQLAAAFHTRAHLDRKTWDPAEFGFVWSSEEIKRYVELSIRRRDALKGPGSHEKIVYEDLPKRN
jgi:hypothetical protein